MRPLPGQAARHAGTVLHRFATFVLGAIVIIAMLLAGGAWRLAQSPVSLAWFTGRLEAAVNGNGGPIRLSIGSTALAWEGFRLGVNHPVDLRLRDVKLSDAAGVRHVEIPQAAVSLSLYGLLRGRFQFRTLEIDGPRLALVRDPDGTLRFGFGDGSDTGSPVQGQSLAGQLSTILATLAQPTSGRGGEEPAWLSQMRHLRIHKGVLTVTDRQNNTTWHAPRAEIDLTRPPKGGVDGVFDLSLAVGDQQTHLIAHAALAAGEGTILVTTHFTPIAPAAFGQALPALNFLSALNAPVSGDATVALGPSFDVRNIHLNLQSGAGWLASGSGRVPIEGASLAASGTPENIHLDSATLEMRGHPDGPLSRLSASGTIHRTAGRTGGVISVDLDHVAFADLPTLWPAALARDARAWVTQNITSGIARDGRLDVSFTANADLSDLTLEGANGEVEGTGLSVTWLRPLLPIEQGRAVLRVKDPDTLEITVASGVQRVKGGKGLALSGGTVRITGLTHAHQVGEIRTNAAGSLADAIALLRDPRLHLMDRFPISPKIAAGEAVANITAIVPMEERTRIDDIPIHVNARVEDAAVENIAAGQNLEHGQLDIHAGNDGLTLTGHAAFAGVPAEIDGALDFRAGPPTQVVQRITLTADPDAKQLASAGFDATELLAGPIGVHAVLQEQRNGIGQVGLDADLTNAALSVGLLDWRKPPGASATARATVRLQQNRLAAIDGITARGDDFAFQGNATAAPGGRISVMRLNRLVLGRSEISGTVQFPAAPGNGPIMVRVGGSQLDLSARYKRSTPPRHHAPPEQRQGPEWTMDAHFDRALMAGGETFAPLTIHADNNGRAFERLRIDGALADKASFTLQIAPQAGVRNLTASTSDAGALMRALNITAGVQEGHLAISGAFDDAVRGHPLRGTVELTDFRVARAAALGKLLQAMTLYGLVDVVRGPGLTFSRLIAPFTFNDAKLELSDARAFSPSLGLTTKGWIETDTREADLHGTIIPAYFFNALLGHVPLVGRLFSPERGGGVFAASYTLRGDLNDPGVSVNPLTALTPGFLRGLFGIF